MLTVRKVEQVVHLLHPRLNRRATFVRVGAQVRYTLYGAGGRRQEVLSLAEARSRWIWLRDLGYQRWEDAR